MDVYIFGAGASAAEGAPATRELLGKAWELLGPEFHEEVTTVWRFLEEVFGVPVTGSGSFRHMPAVDEVVSLVDWSLHVNQGLGRYDPPRLYGVRRALEQLICSTLEAAVDRERCRTGPHARFVRARLSRPHRFAVLSLNYDTLLDRAFAATGVPVDYGLEEAGADRGGSGDASTAAESRPRPLLAKLHGSLGWTRCTACDRIAVAPQTTAHRLPGGSGQTCGRCGSDRLHGLIIPPTWLKSYAGPAGLQRVWDRALAAVQQAERLVFVGYSMPQADLPIYHLIRRGLLVRGRRALPRILVINHHREEASAEARRLGEEAVIDRFTRLFGPHIDFDFSGFRGQV